MNKKLVIYGGGTFSTVSPHLALAGGPAFGGTARRLAKIGIPNMDTDLRLTRMAGGPTIVTNDDLAADVAKVVADPLTKVVVMNAAVCDFTGRPVGRDAKRLSSVLNHYVYLSPADKIIASIRKDRKDIFLVGTKSTEDYSPDDMYKAGLRLCKRASCNLVLVNDTATKVNMIVTPEEARYCETTDRDLVLRTLLQMAADRSHLTFTRSTVVAGEPVKWDSELIPDTLRKIVTYCINEDAYRPFGGVTAGHFACKLSDTEFLTSIRKTNFNFISQNGMVRIKTDGPDTVLAYGAKPSVGGQSQRIVFRDHPDTDCIVHFHCPKKAGSLVPEVSQKEFECGSHECGANTSNGLRKFGNLYAVYLSNHGPNIVFHHSIDPFEVVRFIDANFDLTQKTGGYVT